MSAWFLAAWLVACGADATTTHLALRRGGHELFLTQSPVANDVILGGEALAGVLILTKASRKHPKLAKVVMSISLSAHGVAAVWNLGNL